MFETTPHHDPTLASDPSSSLSSLSSLSSREQLHAVLDANEVVTTARLKLIDALSVVIRSDAYVIDGAMSPAGWVTHQLGMSHTAACRLVSFTKTLTAFPQLRTALDTSAVSFDHAQAIAFVCTEERRTYVERDLHVLIGAAGSLSVSRMWKVVKHWAGFADAEIEHERDIETPNGNDRDPEQTPEAPQGLAEALATQPSTLDVSITTGDMVVLNGVFNAADGALVLAAIEAVIRAEKGDTVRDDEHGNENLNNETNDADDPANQAPVDERSNAQRRADALTTICKTFLDNQPTKTSGGSRPHITITVNEATLQGHGGIGLTARERLGLQPWDVDTFACDSAVRRMIFNTTSVVLDIGRTTRQWTSAQRDAINQRDRHCRFPGCYMPATYTDIHHVIHWTKDGPTNLANGCALCRRHHRLCHRPDGWTVHGNANGELIFTAPDGAVYTTIPPPHEHTLFDR